MRKMIITVAALVAVDLSNPVFAQQKTLAQKLVGTWELVSLSEDFGNGKIVKDPMGKNTKGVITFGSNGRAMFMVIGDDLPPDAARKPEVSARMGVSWFGTYTVDEAAGTYTYTAERATIPAFDGKPRTTKTTWNGDGEFTATAAPVTGPEGTYTPVLVLKRVS